MVSGMRKGGAEGGWPLDGRLLGDEGGPRWSVGGGNSVRPTIEKLKI